MEFQVGQGIFKCSGTFRNIHSIKRSDYRLKFHGGPGDSIWRFLLIVFFAFIFILLKLPAGI